MKPLIMSIALLFSVSLFAGTVELEKAKKEGDAKIAEELKSFKEKCGTELIVRSGHDQAANIKISGRDEANMVAIAGKMCADVVNVMKTLCEDADYKAAVSQLKTLKCNPKQMEKKPYWVAKKDGTTITVDHAPTSSYHSEGIGLFKKLF